MTTAVLLVILLYYGHLANVADDHGVEHVRFKLLSAMLLACGASILGIWSRLRGRGQELFTRILNIAALTMLAFPVVAIADHWLRALATSPETLATTAMKLPSTPKVLIHSDRPDIYYIIADGYSSNGHLLRDYGYDNSSFTSALEDLGFYVAYDSKSNYGTTLHSLSSTLNLQYVSENDTDVDDLAYLRQLIADSKVAQFLVARGYTYLYMLSGYLLPSRIPDVNIDFTPASVMEFTFDTIKADLKALDNQAIVNGRFYELSFYRFFSETTLLRLFSSRLAPIFQGRHHPYHWCDTSRFFATLERLRVVPEMPEATFALVHLLEPHGPVQLRRDGKKLKERTWRPRPELFFAELELINQHLLGTLKAIVESSTVAPIIILQGDHGTNLGRVWTDEDRLTHFEIMNAFLLPGEKPTGLKQDISSINTFQVLLNTYFDGKYEALETRFFDVPEAYEAPFQQIDVTEEFK